MRTEHVCVTREIEDAEHELNRNIERALAPEDVVSFDVGLRILLLKEFADQVVVPLPNIVIEPVELHDRFVGWVYARLALDSAERDLHGRDAFRELIASKRQFEAYCRLVKNRARNLQQIIRDVRESPRLSSVIHDLRFDVLQYQDSYATGGGAIPFLLLTVNEYSHFLKATL